jgi:uncharacterized linocin/CFP29 family protein
MKPVTGKHWEEIANNTRKTFTLKIKKLKRLIQ